MEKYTFPKDFLWGTSTAAHQVEGNNDNDWTQLENDGGVLDNEVSGIAVDHYNKYDEDFDWVKKLNQNVHRISIEWSRIIPQKGVVDDVEIKHYHKVLDALKSRNIKVILTLFHFTLPTWITKEGGWLKSNTIKYFLEFTELITKEYSTKVDYFVTINEPTVYAFNAFYSGTFPPRHRSLLKAWKVLKNLLAAHNKSYDFIKSYNKNSIVGLSHNFQWFAPFSDTNPFDKLLAAFFYKMGNLDVINSIKNHLDFIGVQYYVTIWIKAKLFGKRLGIADSYGVESPYKDLPTSDLGWTIYPKGLKNILLDLKRFNLPILITENGIADETDFLRKDFITDHLAMVARSILAGSNIIGYIYWTLTDNFEWTYGRSARFGLLSIEYKTLKRKKRESASYFSKICESGEILLSTEDK